MDRIENNFEASSSKPTEDQLAKEIELIKCMNEALIQQNVKLIRTETNLRVKLEQAQLKNVKFIQKLDKGILSDVMGMIQDENTKDFSIIINDNEFPVHKFLLEARSSTFASVLRNNPDAHNLVLTDIDEEVFEKILIFLYTDDLPRDYEEDYLKLFTAAGILKIEDLKSFAGVKACNLVKKENVIEVLILSTKYEHDVLKNCAFDEIKKFYPNIKFDNKWINDTHKILEAIEKKKVSRIPVRVSYC
ncbi:unnamed protein product [Chironomus riparius]|uniref:BTB domain-containing protein n=1 Tax=Chironomus riparius TaxID=315576 RepID=A0A9N9RJR0_9DIPT|nr:unnamed protein product [Chironomus riparius]